MLGSNINNSGQVDNAGNAIPIGTTVTNSVYLGNNTVATAGNGVGTVLSQSNGQSGSTTSAGDTGTVTNAVIGSIDYNGFAASTANGVISVGSANSERRLQNLAAGEISQTSSDAINGSQLYAVAVNTSMNRAMALQNQNGLATANALIANNIDNIAANTTDLVNVKAATAKNTNDLATANNAIAQNTLTIANNVAALDTTNGNVSQNTGALILANAAIAKNKDNLVTANNLITGNTNEIAKNAGKLIVLESDVIRNTGDITTANTKILQNAAGLADANTKISQNTVGLTTANTKISQNASDILTNRENITVANNAIAQNGANISQNTQGLANANTAIAENTKGLATANTAIAENSKGLATANTAITKNTNDLVTTNNTVANLGSTVQQNTTKLMQGLTFTDGTNSNSYKLGDSIAVTSTNQNVSVQSTTEGIKVGLNNDLQVNSIRVNNGPSLSESGINAADTRISNVSSGINATDAVNVAQLSKVYEYTREYSQQGDEIAYKGIAMSAALSNGSDAVARPGQLAGMIGVGNFKGNTAMALGMTYLSKESRYKLTGGFAYAGSNDILYQGGIAFAIGR